MLKSLTRSFHGAAKMGRVAILFEALDKADAASPKCRDCSRCADRTESRGMCYALNKHVAYTDPADKCSFFRQTRLLGGSTADAKYGHLESNGRVAVTRVGK